MPKNIIEWNVTAFWGKIAVISWGNPANPPVLMVHGYMDSAATFIPLVEELSDDFYYVGVDLPGLLYNNIFPGKIKKMVFLDPLPPLSGYQIIEHDLPYFYNFLYKEFYGNFEKWNSKTTKLYSFDDAIRTLVRNRNLTEEQSEIVLSRSLIDMGIDSYRLSWETRMKKMSLVTIPEETVYYLMTTNMSPTLSIDASETKENARFKLFPENLINKCDETLPHFHRVTVTGGHDFHITHPKLLKQHIEKLFKANFETLDINVKSKL